MSQAGADDARVAVAAGNDTWIHGGRVDLTDVDDRVRGQRDAGDSGVGPAGRAGEDIAGVLLDQLRLPVVEVELLHDLPVPASPPGPGRWPEPRRARPPGRPARCGRR